MIYDPVDVRISVSNKRQVWKGGSEAPRDLPPDPSLNSRYLTNRRQYFKFSREYDGSHVSHSGKNVALKVSSGSFNLYRHHCKLLTVLSWSWSRVMAGSAPQIIYIKSVMHLQSFPSFVFYQPYLTDHGWDFPYPLSLIIFPVFSVNKMWPFFSLRCRAWHRIWGSSKNTPLEFAKDDQNG